MVNRNYINTDKIKNFPVKYEINAFLNERTPYACELFQFGIPINHRQGHLTLKVHAPNGEVRLQLRDFDCKYDFLSKNQFEDERLFKVYENAWIEFMSALFKDDNYDQNLEIYREEKQAKLAAANTF